MLYSCTHMATVGVKGLRIYSLTRRFKLPRKTVGRGLNDYVTVCYSTGGAAAGEVGGGQLDGAQRPMAGADRS